MRKMFSGSELFLYAGINNHFETGSIMGLQIMLCIRLASLEGCFVINSIAFQPDHFCVCVCGEGC